MLVSLAQKRPIRYSRGARTPLTRAVRAGHKRKQTLQARALAMRVQAFVLVHSCQKSNGLLLCPVDARLKLKTASAKLTG